MARTFIIYVPGFDENVGGVIAMHRLCDVLNAIGERALLWPWQKPLPKPHRPLLSAWLEWRYARTVGRLPYRLCQGFRTPLAMPADVDGAIVLYPEIVDGNPLRARHVVRWLLHRPGFLTGHYEYGGSDRFFFYQKAFDDPKLNPDGGDNLLKTVYLRDDIYRERNFGPRQGSCYILRKGKGRRIVHALEGSVLVDDFSHSDMSVIFNRVECCISYDSYTMYSHFAALCGCDSIIVPEEGVTKESWYPDPADRYGLAYGFDEIQEARRTRPLLLPHLKQQESNANESVRGFVRKCERYFP